MSSILSWILRILRSFFALPIWVIVWISFFLIPANFAGFWFLDTSIGLLIAVLGAGSIMINIVIMFINGGLSKVMAIPHLVMWVPLVAILAYILAFAPPVDALYWVALAVFIINGISLFFDVYDVREWRAGNRQITGFPDAPVRL